MPNAAGRVFQHLELLRLILLRVDPCTLLVSALRVSRRWNAAIMGSAQLQERLFFRPVTLRRGARRVQPVQNPLVVLRGWMFHMLFYINHDDADDLRWALEKGTAYPVHVPSGPSSVVPLRYILHEIQGSLYGTAAFSRRGASWRKLLLQQPPIRSFGLVVSRRSSDGWYDTEMGRADVPRGLRLGHLWDTMRQVLGRIPTSSCYLRLVWWEPTVTPFDTDEFPMADEMVRLFDSGAHSVLLIGYTEAVETQVNGYEDSEARKKPNHGILNRCEEYEPLNFHLRRLPAFYRGGRGVRRTA